MTGVVADSASGRRLDHVVMPVASLGTIRRWFEALGFVVAPEALHPFGTKNACVFFADGTYIEPLAVADPGLAAAQAESGNTFVARDRDFRLRHPLAGFSGAAFRSDDATADLRSFRAAGFEEGDILEFSRSFRAPDGTARDLAFRLGFAADRRSPDVFFFACQPLAPVGDRSALTRHRNAAAGIARLVFSTGSPSVEDFLEAVVGHSAAAGQAGDLVLETAGTTTIEVLTPASLLRFYGVVGEPAGGLAFEGIVLRVANLSEVARSAEDAGMPVLERDGRLVLRFEETARCFIAFEANP